MQNLKLIFRHSRGALLKYLHPANGYNFMPRNEIIDLIWAGNFGPGVTRKDWTNAKK
jgi:hypothetical protein